MKEKKKKKKSWANPDLLWPPEGDVYPDLDSNLTSAPKLAVIHRVADLMLSTVAKEGKGGFKILNKRCQVTCLYPKLQEVEGQ